MALVLATPALAQREVQVRRGSTATADALTLLAGEIYVDTTRKDLRVGDGTTAGGTRIPNLAAIAAAYQPLDADLTALAGSTWAVSSGKLTNTISLAAATGNEIAYTLAYTTNKATSGNDTGLLISMTDTASPGTSLLLDVQVGSSSRFSIANTGAITSATGAITASTPLNMTQTWNAGGTIFYGLKMAITNTASDAASYPLYITSTGSTTGTLSWNADGSLNTSKFIGVGAAVAIENYYNTGINFATSAAGLFWSSTSSWAGTPDVALRRLSPGVLAQRAGTTAQSIQIYGTYIDDSNQCYGSLSGSTTGVTLAANTAGTCADDQNITLTPAGTGQVFLAGTTAGHNVRSSLYGGGNLAAFQGYYQTTLRSVLEFNAGAANGVLAASDEGFLVATLNRGGDPILTSMILSNSAQVFTVKPNRRDAFGGYTGSGFTLALIGGQGQTATTGAAGGSLTITGGAAGGSGNNNGGAVTIEGGAATGSGTIGTIKVGLATTSRLGFWNATPVVQPSSTGETTGWTTGGGSAATSTDTYTGNSGTKAYTVNDIVKHLKAVGILAGS